MKNDVIIPLRKRTNLARKIKTTPCFSKPGKSAWGMRSISDKAKNIQVVVHKSKKITTLPSGHKITHALYNVEVWRITKFNTVQKYFGPHLLEYALSTIMAEAAKKGKKITFYSKLNSVILKKKIQDVSMIEIVVHNQKVWGVFYNELA